MNERDRDLLAQMLEYCTRIDERIAQYSVDEDGFVGDTALQDMLLMPVFQIGELAHALSDDFCDRNPEIPWHAIKAFRNIIAHDYGVVDSLWSWNTITCDVPELEKFLTEALG